MEVILLVIIIVIMLIMRNSAATETAELRSNIELLKREVIKLSQLLKTAEESKPQQAAQTAAPEVKAVQPVPEIKPPVLPVAPSPAPTEMAKEEQPVAEPAKPQPSPVAAEATQTTWNAIRPQQVRYEREPSWFQKWMKNNPDLEKFIGENLINKIGIAVLVLGIAFFVKYAIDQEWINELGRVVIGLLCGAILIGIAHTMRNSYRSFSSVLVGGGITVFYFTIAFAFHEYHLISQTAAFVCMIVITVFAVVLSTLYDRVELGVLATIGGFVTPFLVSTGEGNYIVLFTYLSILNLGLIAIAFYKQWRLVNLLSFLFTLLIYGGWLMDKVYDVPFPARGAFFYASLFYLMFVAMNVIHHVVKKVKLKAFEFIMLLSVNLAYYAAGIIILNNWGLPQYRGLFTATLGVVNLALAYAFFRRKDVDRNFIYLLIGLTLTFISLTAPVQLSGNHITLFWSAEVAVLYWLYLQSQIKLLRWCAWLITALLIISLVMDWMHVYDGTALAAIVWNKAFTTSITAAAALMIVFGLIRKSPVSTIEEKKFTALVYLIAAIVIVFIAGLLEINYQFGRYYPHTVIRYTYQQTYVLFFAVAAFALLRFYKIEVQRGLRLFMVLALAAVYFINASISYSNELDMLQGRLSQVHMVAHWAGAIALAYLLVEAGKAQIINGNLSTIGNTVWLLAAALITLLSIEVGNAYIWAMHAAAGVEKTVTAYHKAGISIVWGLASFAGVWLGIKYRFKMLRVVGLVLFGLTLIKLFSYDIINISPTGKIVAFMLLGVLLLIVSFMYQKVKKILIDDGRNV